LQPHERRGIDDIVDDHVREWLRRSPAQSELVEIPALDGEHAHAMRWPGVEMMSPITTGPTGT
jgi:hypothetical protein